MNDHTTKLKFNQFTEIDSYLSPVPTLWPLPENMDPKLNPNSFYIGVKNTMEKNTVRKYNTIIEETDNDNKRQLEMLESHKEYMGTGATPHFRSPHLLGSQVDTGYTLHNITTINKTTTFIFDYYHFSVKPTVDVLRTTIEDNDNKTLLSKTLNAKWHTTKQDSFDDLFTWSCNYSGGHTLTNDATQQKTYIFDCAEYEVTAKKDGFDIVFIELHVAGLYPKNLFYTSLILDTESGKTSNSYSQRHFQQKSYHHINVGRYPTQNTLHAYRLDISKTPARNFFIGLDMSARNELIKNHDNVEPLSLRCNIFYKHKNNPSIIKAVSGMLTGK